VCNTFLGTLALLPALLFVLLPASAFSQCSGEDISAYMQSGATPQQLSQLCGGQGSSSYGHPFYGNKSPTHSGHHARSVASACITRLGACPMVAELPIGSDCACYTGIGPVAGIAQ
jgi:hypothetical protein